MCVNIDISFECHNAGKNANWNKYAKCVNKLGTHQCKNDQICSIFVCSLVASLCHCLVKKRLYKLKVNFLDFLGILKASLSLSLASSSALAPSLFLCIGIFMSTAPYLHLSRLLDLNLSYSPPPHISAHRDLRFPWNRSKSHTILRMRKNIWLANANLLNQSIEYPPIKHSQNSRCYQMAKQGAKIKTLTTN